MQDYVYIHMSRPYDESNAKASTNSLELLMASSGEEEVSSYQDPLSTAYAAAAFALFWDVTHSSAITANGTPASAPSLDGNSSGPVDNQNARDQSDPFPTADAADAFALIWDVTPSSSITADGTPKQTIQLPAASAISSDGTPASASSLDGNSSGPVDNQNARDQSDPFPTADAADAFALIWDVTPSSSITADGTPEQTIQLPAASAISSDGTPVDNQNARDQSMEYVPDTPKEVASSHDGDGSQAAVYRYTTVAPVSARQMLQNRRSVNRAKFEQTAKTIMKLARED
eukprot:gene399-1794_t